MLELLLVIGVLAILSIVAISKYFNFTATAEINVTEKLASKLNMAARMNFYTRTLNPRDGVKISNCKNAEKTLQGGLPAGYTIKSQTIAIDTIAICTLRGPNKAKANFYVRGIK